MNVVVYDATGHGKARVQPLLTASWKYGTRLYKLHPHAIDHAYGATSWEDALAWLCSVEPTRKIASIQYWGHGLFGRALIADDVLDARMLDPRHPRHEDLVTLRQRLASDEALIWFRTCATFGGKKGQAFATAWSSFFGCRAAGHTFVIGPLQSGLHSLRAGEEPTWSVNEGLPASHHQWDGSDVDEPKAALPSTWDAPHTITCLHGAVPRGW